VKVKSGDSGAKTGRSGFFEQSWEGISWSDRMAI
jgi:hypothetical protein